MKKYLFIFLSLVFILCGCGDNDQKSELSRPTGGELVIGVDESLMPAVNAAIAVFTNIYPEASITPLYLTEKAVTEKLLNNEIQTAVLFRSLTEKERQHIENSFGHRVTSCALGYDRIVAVTGRINPVKTLSDRDIKDILTGKIQHWKQLDAEFEDRLPLQIIIPGSSDIDRILYKAVSHVSPSSTYAAGRTGDVINYISNNPFSIGMINESMIRGKNNLFSDIKIITRISKELDEGSTDEYLSLKINAVTHEPFTGPGTGFISFLANRKGQLILSKAGVIPVKPIERDVKISESF